MPSKKASVEDKLTPEDKKRLTVRIMAGVGVPHKFIAAHIGLRSVNTLKKYYKEELNAGKEETYGFAVGQLMKLIMKGDRASIFFFLKCKGGWRETQNIKVEDVTPKLNITLNAIEAEDDGD